MGRGGSGGRVRVGEGDVGQVCVDGGVWRGRPAVPGGRIWIQENLRQSRAEQSGDTTVSSLAFNTLFCILFWCSVFAGVFVI